MGSQGSFNPISAFVLLDPAPVGQFILSLSWHTDHCWTLTIIWCGWAFDLPSLSQMLSISLHQFLLFLGLNLSLLFVFLKELSNEVSQWPLSLILISAPEQFQSDPR